MEELEFQARLGETPIARIGSVVEHNFGVKFVAGYGWHERRGC